MKLYYAAPIEGVNADSTWLQYVRISLLPYLTRDLGHEIISKHPGAGFKQNPHITPKEVYERDMLWLGEADALIAEVSSPSLGVGFEIAVATWTGKPVLALYNQDSKYRLSYLLRGHPQVFCADYKNLADLLRVTERWLGNKFTFPEF